jgi:GNAT superfamily N-acetyltransferase
VPGGYNGGFAALDPASSAELGRIEYHSADESVLIAWIEVAPALRGRGLADLLLARLAHEFPGARISAGLTTPSGTRWWQRVSRYVRTA